MSLLHRRRERADDDPSSPTGSYKPWAEAVRTIILDERVHIAHGARVCRNLAATEEEGREQLQAAVDRLWPVFTRCSAPRSPSAPSARSATGCAHHQRPGVAAVGGRRHSADPRAGARRPDREQLRGRPPMPTPIAINPRPLSRREAKTRLASLLADRPDLAARLQSRSGLGPPGQCRPRCTSPPPATSGARAAGTSRAASTTAVPGDLGPGADLPVRGLAGGPRASPRRP